MLILGVGGVEEVSFFILEDVFLQAFSEDHATFQDHPAQRPADADLARRRDASFVLSFLVIAVIGRLDRGEIKIDANPSFCYIFACDLKPNEADLGFPGV